MILSSVKGVGKLPVLLMDAGTDEQIDKLDDGLTACLMGGHNAQRGLRSFVIYVLPDSGQ